MRGKDLKREFNDLFDKQKAKEDRLPANKKRIVACYANTLKPKQPLDSLSTLFQDPDLLIQATGGDVQFITGRSNVSRRRNLLENVTTSRPQAKDVSSTRVHDDADLSGQDILNGFYHHPKGPKKRIYLAESEDSQPSSSSSVTNETTFSIAPRVSQLALPTLSITRTFATSEEQQQVQVQSKFNQAVERLRNSSLKTIDYKGLYSQLPRLRRIKQYKCDQQQVASNQPSDKEQLGSDIIMTVIMFSHSDKHLPMQEIELLGTQTLRDLRNIIICPVGNVDQSVMFINDEFYTDTKNRKIEKMAGDWLLENTEKPLSEFTFQRLSKVLENLKIEINKPYCFLHHSTCEHMFVVKDIRLLSEKDNKNAFPKTIRSLKYTRYKCSMCSVFPATYLTKNDVLSGFSPCYFCNNCHVAFHANTQSAAEVQGFEIKPYHGDIV